ncbi:MAG: amidohydrolase family protein [Burkholderiales bacterium]|nr:amidohydrolase family protein [Phycisphaerae bacterium]
MNVATEILKTPKPAEYNRVELDFRTPMPHPKVRGMAIDYHSHLFAHRQMPAWQEANRHFGIGAFVTMTPLEEAVRIKRSLGERVQFIAVPKWGDAGPYWVDDWLRRLEAFYNLGSRIVKFHMAPLTMVMRNYSFEHAGVQRVIKEAVSRKMILMSHVGDPDLWYQTRYTDTAKYGTRQQHYEQWEAQLAEHRDHPWVGAHLGGNPENPGRLQQLLDTYPNLHLDLSATRWMVREVSIRRDAMRDFVIRNQDRLLWGSDQVSGDQRGFDFLASRLWCHRKLWETAYIGPSPIYDPELPEDRQPVLRGLAMPDEVLQKIYHDNTVTLLGKYGVHFG